MIDLRNYTDQVRTLEDEPDWVLNILETCVGMEETGALFTIATTRQSKEP